MEEVYPPTSKDDSAPSNGIASRIEIFPSDLLQKLKAVGRSEQVTLPVTLLGAFHTLLYRYGGEEEASSPAPNSYNSSGMVAQNRFFGNAGLSGKTSFRQLLRQIRSAAPGPSADQNAPWKLIAFQTDGDPCGAPLFQTQLALAIAPRPQFKLPVGDWRSFAIVNGT